MVVADHIIISFVEARPQVIRIESVSWSRWLALHYLGKLLLSQEGLEALELALLWSSLGVVQR